MSMGLQVFLFDLLRDKMPVGEVEEMVKQQEKIPAHGVYYSDKASKVLAQLAKHYAQRLLAINETRSRLDDLFLEAATPAYTALAERFAETGTKLDKLRKILGLETHTGGDALELANQICEDLLDVGYQAPLKKRINELENALVEVQLRLLDGMAEINSRKVVGDDLTKPEQVIQSLAYCPAILKHNRKAMS